MTHPHDHSIDYRYLRASVGLYRRDRGLARITGLERGELIRYLLARDTEYTEPLTCSDSLVLNPDGTALDLVTHLELDAESWLIADRLDSAELVGLITETAADLGLSDITVADASRTHDAVAFEGPVSWRLAAQLIDFDISSLILNAVTEVTAPGSEHGEHPALLARTGSTGEYGYLLITAAEADAVTALTALAEGFGGGWVGPEALSRARAEVRHPHLPLQSEGLAVREAGLEWLVGLTREDSFRGGQALKEADEPSYGLIAAVGEAGEALTRGALVRAGAENAGHVQAILPRAGTEHDLLLLAMARPFDVPGLDVSAESAGSGTVLLRTVSSPVVVPLSWTQGLGE